MKRFLLCMVILAAFPLALALFSDCWRIYWGRPIGAMELTLDCLLGVIWVQFYMEYRSHPT